MAALFANANLTATPDAALLAIKGIINASNTEDWRLDYVLEMDGVTDEQKAALEPIVTMRWSPVMRPAIWRVIYLYLKGNGQCAEMVTFLCSLGRCVHIINTRCNSFRELRAITYELHQLLTTLGGHCAGPTPRSWATTEHLLINLGRALITVVDRAYQYCITVEQESTMTTDKVLAYITAEGYELKANHSLELRDDHVTGGTQSIYVYRNGVRIAAVTGGSLYVISLRLKNSGLIVQALTDTYVAGDCSTISTLSDCAAHLDVLKATHCTTEEYSDDVKALAYHIADTDDVDSNEVMPLIEADLHGGLEYDGREYRVLTDSEADAAWSEYMDDYITECVLPELPQHLQSYFDGEAFKRDAKFDGRGRSLASYDGEEHEQRVDGTWFFIYRTN